MVKYFCDICNHQCDGLNKYLVPQIVYNYDKQHKSKTLGITHVMLCERCAIDLAEKYGFVIHVK